MTGTIVLSSLVRFGNTSAPSPPRARIAGLRASSFGDLIFVDHAEINYGMNSLSCLACD